MSRRSELIKLHAYYIAAFLDINYAANTAVNTSLR